MDETMPAYLLNPHRHVKIWLSDDENQFLNPENQLRLVTFREKNKTDEISFIYSKNLLSVQAKQDLEKFCQLHNIHPYSLEDDIAPQLLGIEKELFDIALKENQAAKNKKGGSYASMSDILRVLSPVYKKGIYSDTDEFSIDTTELPAQIPVRAPMIFNIGSAVVSQPEDKSEENKDEPTECIIFNNDILAIPEVDKSSSIEVQRQSEELQQKFIHNYHQFILSGYQNLSDHFNKLKEFFDDNVNKYVKNFLFYPNGHSRGLMSFILENIKGNDPITVRNNINKILSDPLERMKNILIYRNNFYNKYPSVFIQNVNDQFHKKENISFDEAIRDNRLDLIKDFYIYFARINAGQILDKGSDEKKAHLTKTIIAKEQIFVSQAKQFMSGIEEEIQSEILKMFKYINNAPLYTEEKEDLLSRIDPEKRPIIDVAQRFIDDSDGPCEEKIKFLSDAMQHPECDEEDRILLTIIINIAKARYKVDEEIAIEFSRLDEDFGDPGLALLYKETVVSVTGPMVGAYLLDADIVPSTQVDQRIGPYSFQFYDSLKNCFKTNAIQGLHAQEYEPKPGDSSWLPEGAKAVVKREEKLTGAVMHLQKLFRAKKMNKFLDNDSPSSNNPTKKI